MPETDSVDHSAFERLRAAIDRARRTRRGWSFAVIAAVPVAFVVGWSTLLGVALR